MELEFRKELPTGEEAVVICKASEVNTIIDTGGKGAMGTMARNCSRRKTC